MGAHLAFKAEAEHVGYCHINLSHAATSIRWRIDRIRPFMAMWNATCIRAVGRTARKALSTSASERKYMWAGVRLGPQHLAYMRDVGVPSGHQPTRPIVLGTIQCIVNQAHRIILPKDMTVSPQHSCSHRPDYDKGDGSG